MGRERKYWLILPAGKAVGGVVLLALVGAVIGWSGIRGNSVHRLEGRRAASSSVSRSRIVHVTPRLGGICLRNRPCIVADSMPAIAQSRRMWRQATSPRGRRVIHHYLYVLPDHHIYIYDTDRHFKLIKSIYLPQTAGVRGAVASPSSAALYISYGGDGGSNGNGSMLMYNLRTNHVVWSRSYAHGIDSMDISPNGRRIYMPDGELSPDGTWYVEDSRTGKDIGTISGGTGPHNTIAGLGGSHVYLGGRNHNYLEVARTSDNAVTRRIGPLESGVRPFTVNGKETLVFTTATRFLGFQVSSIRTGRVLYTVSPKGFTWNPTIFRPSCPSHGISMSPNERELWVLDAPNSYVHVYDVTRLPRFAPRLLANIRLSKPLSGNETLCSYDCLKDGWVLHSRNGRYVFVGDEGDVIDTASRRVVANLPMLANTRKFIEIDFRNGVPVATTGRSGRGYVTR